MISVNEYKERVFKKKRLNIENTARCTLLCPLCKRSTFLHLNNKSFPGKDLTPAQFKKIIKYFKAITFGGQLSDPVFGKHFLELLDICYKEKLPRTRVLTAATGKSEAWYKQAFETNPDAIWTFGIDGPPHLSSTYRINQDGEFLFKMMCLAREMKIKTIWQYIIFPYNKKYVEECKARAEQLGIEMLFIESERSDFEQAKTEKAKKLSAEEKIQLKEKWVKGLEKRGIKNKILSNFKPRCIYENQEITLSSEGYFTPCCWTDDELYNQQPWINSFFLPHLHIDNNDTVEQIFNSKEWRRFFKMLLKNPNNAPPVCFEYCASAKGDHEILKSDKHGVTMRQH